MLCQKLLRSSLMVVAENLLRRGFHLDADRFAALEAERQATQTKVQDLQTTRNTESKRIGKAKANGEDIKPLVDRIAHLGDSLTQAQTQLDQTLSDLNDLMLSIPNTLQDSVPDGKSEEDNVLLRSWREPTTFSFTPKDHIELGLRNRAIDFEAAANLSGSRFVVLRQDMARLHRALGQFMLDLHVETHGYMEHYVPVLVKKEALYGTSQLPKFGEDLFHTTSDLSLISTAEVSLTNLVRDSILNEADLPMKLTTQTPCFRSEAGSYGRDTAGMIRQHQFEKVELVQITTPERSQAAFEELTEHAEAVLQALNLPYRAMMLCAGDVGFASMKTIDLEVWLPGQNCYREISSCSLFGDFQARRMMARYRPQDGGKPSYVHTVNGSGLAVGRTLIAVVENYQQEDGTIVVPDVLVPYMNGKRQLG